MGVFLKYISKNMLEKKGRLFLLIFSIMCCTALLIMSLGLVDVLLDSFTQPAREAAEGQDITIYSTTDEQFFDENDVKGNISDLTGGIGLTGVLNEDEIIYVNIDGKKGYDKDMVKGSLDNVNEKACVISDRIADERNLDIGDKLTVAVNGEKTDFEIKGIAANGGIFYGDTKKNFTVVVPYAYLDELLEAGGKYNYMRAKVDSEDKSYDAIKGLISDFNDENDKVAASALVNDSTDGSESITLGLYVMLSIVCVVCVIIIYGAFKLIITERITVIGTFMSQGATKKKIEHILLVEAVLYGVCGSAFGVGAGLGGLKLLTNMISPLREYGIYMPLRINGTHILIGVLFAVLLSVISAWIPIRSIRKFQVKDVILNRMETTHKKGAVRFTIGCILLALSVVGALVRNETIDALAGLFLVFAIIGMLMMSRKFIKVVSGKIAGLFRGHTTTFLSLNAIKTSKLLRGNITLLVLTLSSVMLIASIGASMTDYIVDAYEELNYDYMLSAGIPSNDDVTTTQKIVNELKQIDGVDGDRICTQTNAYANLKDDKYAVVMAADPERFAEWAPYLELKSDEYIDGFNKYKENDGKVIMASKRVLKDTGTKVGDMLEIEIEGIKDSFEIIGEFDGKQLNGGVLILMKEDKMSEIFKVKESNSITFFLKDGADADKVEKALKDRVGDYGATYMSKQEMVDDNVQSNQMIIDILSIFTYLALVIASIGIFNNISISFAQRKKEFAVMASVGMNIKQRRRMILSESITGVVWSAIASIPYTMLLCILAQKLLENVDMGGLDVVFSWKQYPIYLAVIAFVIFLASIGSMKNIAKLKVVEELKYE
ncbi:MAG: ABC transporter permease [Ruminococcus sp.]|nr:ABC transporter permease [Ruminococcus sp.]